MAFQSNYRHLTRPPEDRFILDFAGGTEIFAVFQPDANIGAFFTFLPCKSKFIEINEAECELMKLSDWFLGAFEDLKRKKDRI